MLQLARHNVLATQLTTVEVLARVDILCLDKTGTITTGDMDLGTIEPVGEHTAEAIRSVLSALVVADPSPNATMAALGRAAGPDPGWTADAVEPFSSTRKWSAATFGHDTFVLGAPEVVLGDGAALLERVGTLAGSGRRVLAVAHARSPVTDGRLPEALDARALVVLEDAIRPDAPATIAYFHDQRVDLRVISGDDPQTVAAIASRAGMTGTGAASDARSLSDGGDDLAAAVARDVVIGRVSPHQKQAMIGVAMGSGSAAARSVADLVLTDSSFASLPVVVDEGRKVINNVERVANLFLTKSVYAVLLTLVVAVARVPFPFLPRQLTLIGTFSIGLPGVFLALAPEVSAVRPGFLDRVLRFSIPAGLIAGSTTLAVFAVARQSGSVTLPESRTATTMTLLGIGLVVLLVASRPLRPWKVGLTAGMAALYGLIFSIGPLRDFFLLDLFAAWMWPVVVVAVVGAGALVAAIPRWVPGLTGWDGHPTPSRPLPFARLRQARRSAG